MTSPTHVGTVTVRPDLETLRVACDVLASLCDGIARELRIAAEDLSRLAHDSDDIEAAS